jgi:hypothetical protein
MLGQQAGHADFEELIKVAADDAQEAQALTQRHACVLGRLITCRALT